MRAFRGKGGLRVCLVLAAMVLLPVAEAHAAGPTVTLPPIGIGGTTTPAVAGPALLTSNGYGPGVAVGEEGNTYVAWNEPRDNHLDAVGYCRVVRPGLGCGGRQTFNPPGFVTPDPNTRYTRDGAHSVFVLSPRPDEVVILTTRYRDPAEPGLAVGSDGLIGSCGQLSACFESHNPVFAYVSHDGGVTFQEKIIGETKGGVVAVGTMTVDAGTPDERDLILLYSDQNQLVVTTSGAFATSCADLSGPGGNLPVEAALGVQGGNALLTFNQGSKVYTRRFTATTGSTGAQTTSDLCNVDRWGGWQTVSGSNTSARLASGSSGSFLLTERQTGSSRQRISLNLTTSNGSGLNALGIAHDAPLPDHEGDIAQDGLGALTAAWVDPRLGASGRVVGHDLRFATAAAAAPFLAATTVRPLDSSSGNPGIERLHLATLDDGGGAIVYQHSGAANLSGPASISLLVVGTRTPRVVDDIHISGAEITQGVQRDAPLQRDRSNPGRAVIYDKVGELATAPGGEESARLVQGKQIVVRVYGSTRSPLAAGALPAAELRVRRNGKLINTILPNNPTGGLPIGDAFNVNLPQHQGSTQVYTFVLPPVFDFASYEYEAQINPAAAVPGVAECRTCRGVDNFIKLGPQRFFPVTTVNVLPLEINVGPGMTQRPRGTTGPSPAGPMAVFGNAAIVLPVLLSVPPYQFVISQPSLATDDNSALDRATEARDLVSDWADDTDNDRSGLFPIGIYPFDGTRLGLNTPQIAAGDPQWLRGGKGYNKELFDPLRCSVSGCTQALYQDRQPVAVLGDSVARDIYETAHEIVHGLGFRHAGADKACYAERDKGEQWPFGDDGKMDGIGLDMRQNVGGAVTGAPPFFRVVQNLGAASTTVSDMMSYCGPKLAGGLTDPTWLSVYNWNRISAYFAPPPGGSARASAASAPVAGASAGVARSLLVSAAVPSGGGGKVIRVRQSDHAPVTQASIPHQQPYVVVGYDAAGAEKFRAAVEISSGQDDGSAPVDLVRAYLPLSGISRIQVVRSDGAALADRSASAHAPTVAITSPRRGATVGRASTVLLTWNARDADGDRLEASIEYAANGRTFRSIGDTTVAGRMTLPSRLFTRASAARVRVRVNDGFHETTAVVGPIKAIGTPPEIQVLTPATGARTSADASVTLQATAWDELGRKVSDRRIRWLQGKRVVLARGTGTAMLPAGRQTLTVEARDLSGRKARRTVVVRVAAARPRFLRIGGPARVKLSARKVTLKFAASFPSTLRIAGRRRTISRATTSVVVSLPRKGATIRFPIRLSSGPYAVATTLVVIRR
jgi:hypothetical protein